MAEGEIEKEVKNLVHNVVGSASEANPYPSASASNAEDGAYECRLVDVASQRGLEDVIRDAAAALAARRASGTISNDPIAHLDSSLQKVLRTIRCPNDAHQQQQQETSLRKLHTKLRELATCPEALGVSGATVRFIRSGSSAKEGEAFQEARRKLDERSLECDTPGLLREWDSSLIAHDAIRFHTERERNVHERSACIFRRVNCPHCCGATFSAHFTRRHDAICGEKHVPCEQACGKHVPRKQMNEHIHMRCELRPAKCPFGAIGCPSEVKHRDIEEHLRMQTVNHALLLLSTLQTHQAQNGEQDQAISELRNELSSKDQRINEAAATAAAASTATATLTKRLESLESGPSDVKKLQNDVKKLQSKNKELESKNEELGKELKHLRESLKQEAAWRHEATKQMTSSTSSG